jgi:hypothetical protein
MSVAAHQDARTPFVASASSHRGSWDRVTLPSVPNVHQRLDEPDGLVVWARAALTAARRASERQHPVQGSGSDSNLGRLGPVGVRSKGIADYTFVSPDRRLDLGPQIVAAGFLSDRAATFGTVLHRGGARRDVDTIRPTQLRRTGFNREGDPLCRLAICGAGRGTPDRRLHMYRPASAEYPRLA